MATSAASRRIHGFSLIELLVVISIIAVLSALLLPAVGLVKEQSRALVCSGQMRQVVLGIEAYRSDYSTCYPPAAISTSLDDWVTSRGTGRWQNLVEAYVETYQVFNCPAARIAQPANDYTCRVRNAPESWIGRGDAASGTVCLMAYNLNDWGRYPSVSGQRWQPSNPGPMIRSRVESRIANAGFPGSAERCPVVFDGLWINNGISQQTNRAGTFFPHRSKANMAFADGHTESHVMADIASFGDWSSQPLLVRD